MTALVALVVILIALRFMLPAGTPRIRAKRGAVRSIAVLEKVPIGGCGQWVLERSEDVANPIVLFLHGGPGTSQLTSNRRDTRELERFFIVVNWDQRGAGKSYAAIHDTARMNIAQFVEDTRELTLYLLKKFGKQRLILAGHSWGSVIGVMTVAKYPELFSCYVGIGQVANMRKGETASYLWTLEQARAKNDRRAIRTLEEMGMPPYQGDWQAKTIGQRKLLARFGGEIHGSSMGAMGHVLGSLLFSREYALKDRINFFRGIFGSMKLLWMELFTADLFSVASALAVPVFLAEGRHDHESPSEIAAEYFCALRAPSKELIWFEHSAHLPNSEERDAFNKMMVEKVRPLATQNAGS